MPTNRPLMIMIAAPYRSGTNDDPAKMHANVRAGHTPIVGEWLALPLVEVAGSQRVGDAAFTEIFHPIAHRVALRCDACLRIGGASQGADEMVRIAQAEGQAVYYRLEDIPNVTTQ